MDVGGRSPELRLFRPIIVALATATCLIGIGRQSLDPDERHNVEIARRPFGRILEAHTTRYDLNTPLYSYVLHGAIMILGTGDAAVRLVPALCGILIVVMTLRIGARLLDPRAALLGAGLLSVSAFLVYHVQYCRPHGLGIFFMLLSIDSFVEFRENRSWRSLVSYAIWVLLAFYTLIFALVVVGFLNVYALLQWRRDWPTLRRWLLVQAAVLIGVEIWLPVFLLQAAVLGEQSPAPSMAARIVGLPAVLMQWSMGMTVARRVFGGRFFSIDGIWAAISLFAYAFPALASLRADLQTRRGGLILCWVILPPLAFYLAWLTVNSEFEPRYTLISLPAYFMFVAQGLLALRSRIQIAVCLCAMVGVNGVSLYNYHFVDDYRREPLRPAVRYVEEAGAPGDLILYSSRIEFLYYQKRGDLELIEIEPHTDRSLLEARLAGRSRVWVIFSGWDSWQREFFDWMDKRYRRTQQKYFPGVRAIRVLLYASRG